MNPMLSIIVPVYDVENYLAQCVDSILNQPYTDFELILVDDGSPDNCGNICDAYALQDKRIIVIHKENGGLSSARNAAIDIARGKYLSFIDSDDFISNDYYQKNMEYIISNPQTDVLVLQVCNFDNNKNEVVYNEKRELKSHIDIVSYMLSMDYIGAAWINIYKRDLFRELRYPLGKIFEDGYILSDIVEKTNNLFITDIGVYYYRKRCDSIMGKSKTIKNWCDVLSTHVKQLDYCYAIPDNKKLFLEKYKICSLALIYASIEYTDGPFKEYRNKFQSYDYNLLQLLQINTSFKQITKLYFLKYFGYMAIVYIYKLLGTYRKSHL